MITYNKPIDMKHSIRAEIGEPEEGETPVVNLFVVKHENNTKIPDEEPTILFRGRDRLALSMLKFYKDLCEKDGATGHQLTSIDEMIGRFEKFSKENSEKMKQPGITLGK